MVGSDGPPFGYLHRHAASHTARLTERFAEPVAVVKSQVEAFNRGGFDAFASFYADDAEPFDLGPRAKPALSGRAALTPRYKPMLERYHPKASILSRMQSGDFVIDRERTDAADRSSQSIAIYKVGTTGLGASDLRLDAIPRVQARTLIQAPPRHRNEGLSRYLIERSRNNRRSAACVRITRLEAGKSG